MLGSDTLVHNRYRIIRLIGEGGMGAVYEASDQHLSKTVALKQTRLPGAQVARSFEHEAHILSRLQHPALPKVTDYFTVEDTQFLVMDYIPGADLGALLNQEGRTFSIEMVLDWADQLLDVLEYLHAQRSPVIHRDIKPQNLKLTPEGRIILLDFGLAKGAVTTNMPYTSTHSIIGYTLQFTAPEQLQRAGTDQRSDLYSLAATLYCLLTYSLPAGAMERAICVGGHLPDPIRPAHEVNPQVPPAISNVLMRAMMLNPGKRFPDAASMRAALHDAYAQSQQERRAGMPTWAWPAVGGAIAIVLVTAAMVLSSIRMAPLVGALPATSVRDSGPPTVNIAAQSSISSPGNAPSPTVAPTIAPTVAPTIAPTVAPTIAPTIAPTTACEPPGASPTYTLSCYAPELEAALITHGYEKNVVRIRGRRGLRVGQGNDSMWIRDIDYATSGYSYTLTDMSLLRQSIELFLKGVGKDGVPPEAFVFAWANPNVYSKAWDSTPNLIHAVYAYVAKTGDRAFYETHRATLQRAGNWIVALDADGDGLPDADRDRFAYGYYNSVTNGVRHTYALAKFYAAFDELAALEQYAGHDPQPWTARAQRLRAAFHAPASPYWPADQPWPIAWLRPDGAPVAVLETFGVFEALRSGLIAPADGARYRALVSALHTQLPQLIGGPTPLRLAVGGYDEALRRPVDPPVPRWMLDASAPWVVGLAAPAYAAAGYPADAQAVMQAYMTMARAANPPVLQFAAGPDARYGAGESRDRGQAWDNAAWFLAIYGGHYGLTLTPEALLVQPRPFRVAREDGVRRLTYQGAAVTLALDVAGGRYTLQTDRPITVLARPMGSAARLRVDGGAAAAEARLLLQPGRPYIVTSER